jgi:site-specific DNA-methyltransferase (adenine-specific)/modification methylase
MITLNTIYNENCNETMKRMADKSCDLILTSPPYNSGRGHTIDKRNPYAGRYDIYLDDMNTDEYLKWTVDLFNSFDRVLNDDGVVLYNISYGSDTKHKSAIGLMWLVVAEIIKNTNFTVADRIIWKKRSALPNSTSPNKLTRICEDVFVFVRKNEINTFKCNKHITSVNNKGQKYFETIYNFIEAPNNDGSCDLNKATYSSELCCKLLNIYAVDDDTVVYDPFMGTGTTAVACKKMNFNYIGSELSKNQCEYAEKRINSTNSVNNVMEFTF